MRLFAEALDWLRAALAEPTAAALRPLLGDPLGVFVDYGAVLVGEEEPGAFVTGRAGRPCSQDEITFALELLELKSHLLSAFTSCAWFFADPMGIETLSALRHAARRARYCSACARYRRHARLPRAARTCEVEHRCDSDRP